MNALIFILVNSFKNNIKEIVRKPAKLAVALFIIVMIVGLFLLSIFTRTAPEHGAADLIWLKGIVFAVFALFMIIGVQKGLANGDAIFAMSDVSLLFVSPVDPRHILFYGIVQMAKMSLVAGFFILFQGNSICANFDLSYWAVLLVFSGFILSAFFMQIVSLIIYSFANGRAGRKRLVRLVTALLFAPLVIVFGVNLLQGQSALVALEATLRSPALSWIPAAGWAAEGSLSLIAGNLGTGFLFYGLIILVATALVFYIMRSNPDYYEDVLVAAETTFEKKRAAAEGKTSLEAISERRIKVAKTGINGYGASALFFKHLRESIRSGQFGLWGMSSFLIVAGAIAFSFIARDVGIITILITLIFIQMFMIGTGRGLKELMSHYIYMMPESAFSKILWSNAETVLKTLGESVVLFIAAGLIMGESAIVILLCVMAYTSFTLLLIGINYLFLRVTGMNISTGLTIMIYPFVIVCAMLPGLVLAIIAGVVVGEPWGIVVGLLVVSLWELTVACLSFIAAKSMLHNCDMMTMSGSK